MVVLLIVAFLIVFPPLANSSVRIALSSSSVLPVEHLYVTIAAIRAHRADAREPSGWSSVTNASTKMDLAVVNSSQTVALGFLSLGQYDKISVEVTNATVILNGISKPAQMASRVFTVPVSFLVRFGVETTITLKVVPEVQEGPDIMNLDLSFTAESAS